MSQDHINALKAGAVVEEFRIERMLGHGGFGITYLARDLHLNNLVAMKEYLPQEFAVRGANSTIVPKSTNDQQGYEWGLDRFKQEARALARFKHANIVRASRLIEANGTAYLVMDYEVGMTLGEYLKKHGPTLDEARVLGVFLPILDGLYALHRAELIHRDIKPGNIYVRADGGPMLIDFGAVRHAVGAHSRSLTAVVTPGFAPIEQYSSEGKQGPWTDLYAVGATMYTCILGRSPVDAARRSAAISDGDPDPLVSAARVGKGKYSDEILAAIDWAMQFRTRDRPQTAHEFKARLKQSKVKAEQLTLDTEDEDRTAMGAGKGAAAAPAPAKAVSRPFSTPVPSGDADVASAPMEWFDAPVDAAPAQSANYDDDDPLNQTSAGLILGAAVGARPSELEADLVDPRRGGTTPRAPTAPVAAAPPAAPVKSPAPKAAPPKTAPPKVSTAPAAKKGGGLIAQAAAGRRPSQMGTAPPPTPNTFLRSLMVLLVLGALGAAAWWVTTGEQRRDRKLWAAATRADSLAGYESYLAACALCLQQDAAERAIVRQRDKAAAVEVSGAKQQQVSALKVRFAQHLIAGEIDAPTGANATTVLEELALLTPGDVFVISGREQLALRRQDHGPSAKPKQAAVEPAPRNAASAPTTPASGAAAGGLAVVGSTVKPVVARPTLSTPARAAAQKPAPTSGAGAAASVAAAAPAASIDKMTQVFDLVAKFELAMAREDFEGPDSAQAQVQALEALAPGDPIVKDVRRRYDDAAERRAQASKPASVLPQPQSVLPSARTEPAADAATPPRATAPTAPPPPGTAIVDSLGPLGAAPTMVALAGGSVRIGDLAGVGNPDEQPIVSLRLAPFAIGRREITRAQFRAFADATKHQTEAERGGGCRVARDGAWTPDPGANWRKLPFAQGDDEPVVCVTPGDALAYAAWLSRVTGHRYRLPTEAEWEYAARGGTETSWWWGNAADGGAANCDGCAGRTQLRTVEAGQYERNAFGLVDVIGNAWEWTCSAYTRRLAVDSVCTTPRADLQMVMRGGSWATPPERARVSSRGYAVGDYASDNNGFRLVREF